MKTTVIIILLFVCITWVQSYWIIGKPCSNAPANFAREVRAINGDCAQIDESRWRLIQCDSETAKSLICSDSTCQTCSAEFSMPLNNCDNYVNFTCQKNEPNLKDLVGENYLIFARSYTCSSVFSELAASDPYCFGFGGESTSAKCTGNQASLMKYSNEKCLGKPNVTYNITLNQCDSGLETFCNQN